MTTPRYITQRTSRYSYGPKIARVSEHLGRPFMPWQHAAAGLIGETDATGRILHPLVVITVPRQSGKTALVHAVGLHRLTMRQQCRAWYTAQTGIKAREQATELFDTVDLSPLRSLFHSKRGAGETSTTLKALGSTFKAHPPTPDSLHGNQSDLNLLDEGWFYDETLAAALMGAITPTQNTRPNAQTVILSTMGTAQSTWFHGLVERGRAGELCLIDYGIGADVDPQDDDAIAAAHPAIGQTIHGHTITRDILVTARAQLSPGEFVRAYGNRATAAFDRLIPAEIAELASTTADLPAGRVSFGAAVSFDRDDAAIVSCVIDSAGIPWLEVVAVYPRADELPQRLAALTGKHGGHVVMDASGPAASTAAAAKRAGAIVSEVGSAELSAGTTDLLDRLRRPIDVPGAEPAVRLRAHQAFTDALEVAALRTSGDRVMWSRRGSAASIAALEAGTLAIHAAHTRPNPPVAPMIWSQ